MVRRTLTSYVRTLWMSSRRRVFLVVLLLSPATDCAQSLVVERVKLEGVAAFPEGTVWRCLNLRPGVLPAESEIKKAVERVLSYYEERGYPFCSVGAPRIRSLASARQSPASSMEAPPAANSATPGDQSQPHSESTAPDTLDSSSRIPVEMIFRIDEGPIVLIDSIDVEGNKSTRREVITRQLGFRKGSMYQQRRIDDGVRRLLRSGLFEAVDGPEVLYDTINEQFVLQIGVREGRTGRFDGIAGYAPGSTGSRGGLTGSMSVGLNNLFGSARRFSAEWRRLSSGAADLSIGYREPWVAGTPVAAEGTVQNTERKGYTRRELELRAEVPVTLRATVRISCGWFSVIPDSQAAGWSVPPPDRRTGRRLGAGFQYDTRDDVLNPSQGTCLSASASFGASRISAIPAGTPPVAGNPSGDQATPSTGTGRHEAAVERFLSFVSGQTVLASIRAIALSGYGSAAPLSEKVRLGGASTLRGYREEEFVGDRAFLATFELRHLLSERSRAFLFADAAQIEDRKPAGVGEGGSSASGNGAGARTRIRRLGYGAGVRLNSQAGLVGVDYGLGRGDRLSQGKLHVRFINDF